MLIPLLVRSFLAYPSKRLGNKKGSQNLKQTLFAVPMTCDGCAKDITNALYKLPGILKVEANVKDQLVSIEGTGTSPILPLTV